ncbi:hypothetical protein AB833_09910 [Chromatiales bacterium (ex Bugula neritina AB1)]|nr:hypothetical protein AB833_09910 [Chromatiales bacterium (ex Bugula neritina AB1)]
MSFDLYSWNTPNGQKATIALEEAGADYTLFPVNIGEGAQHVPGFRQISPDGKIPALVVHAETPVTLFESGAILVYLANQFPVLHGRSEEERARVMSWLFWQVGQLGPLIGQFGRFSGASPLNTQAVKHFEELITRCLDVMEKRLAETEYLAGENFTIADIACYPWVASPQSYMQRYGVGWRERYAAIPQWTDNIARRPAVQKAQDAYQ